uniref:hypothetical protein n=1 Tax=Bacillus pumilus TaxID=1408 RepID=UPI001C92E7D2
MYNSRYFLDVKKSIKMWYFGCFCLLCDIKKGEMSMGGLIMRLNQMRVLVVGKWVIEKNGCRIG